MQGAADAVFAWLHAFSMPVLVGLLAAFGLLVLGFGIVTSTVANLVMFHGFVLTLRGDVVQRRYGLITTRAKSLPLRRVQRVLLEQAWLRRLFHLAVVRADSAGSSMDPSAEAKGGWDVVLPLASLSRAVDVLRVLLPGLRVEGLDWRRVSSRVVLRVFLKGALLVASALAVGLPLLGLPALLALTGLPLAWLLGYFTYVNLGFAQEDQHIAFRWGLLGRYYGFVPTRKIQSVILRAGPLQRALGLATLTVYVAGGSPTSLADLPRADAEQLRGLLARAAARAAAAEWRAA
jgi:uncharacterized membrane protein YdbT with pleckstrin-like domain